MAESSSSSSVEELIQRLIEGDQQALAELFSRYRERLWNIVNLRLDNRLKGRVDADDVLQEVYLDAADRVEHYIKNREKGTFFVWLRLVTAQTLINVHRRHLDSQMRDAKREMSIHIGRHYHPATTSLAIQLLGDITSPSRVAMREETARQLEEVLESMGPLDREILTLRHFEQLSNKEVAEFLGIQAKAASIRYVRALKRLKGILEENPHLNDS